MERLVNESAVIAHEARPLSPGLSQNSGLGNAKPSGARKSKALAVACAGKTDDETAVESD